jgi:hypothetical protein
MNTEEARLILQACRLGGQDDRDPRVAEALEQAARDPELRAWYQARRSLDSAICDKLREVPVPRHLAGSILARKRATSDRKRARYLTPLALAASIALLLSLGWLISRRLQLSATEFTALRSDMAGLLMQFPQLDLATERWPDIARWLGQKPGLAQVEIPARLQQYPGLGCREVRWRNKRLMLVCFVAQGEIVHLFVVPRAELEGLPAGTTPGFARVRGWSTASWTRGEVAYLVLTRGDPTFLSGLVDAPNGA